MATVYHYVLLLSGKLKSKILARNIAICAVALVGALGPGLVVAQNAAMIEAGNAALREDIQWLVDRAIIGYVSTSTWPIPVSVLEAALESRRKKDLTRADVHAILSIRRYLDDQKKVRYGLVAKLNTDSIPQLGFANQSRAAATGGVFLQGGNDVVAGKLQVNALADRLTSKQSRVNLEGSYVSAQFLGQAVYAGQLAHYWGPGSDGSLNWGNAGTAIPGIGLQRARQTAPESQWLSWVGPWGYDVFLGQLQHDTAVPNARVINMRVFARPFKGLELGASRFIEWGGDGRPNGFNAIWKALAGDSNTTAKGSDPSNELAGVDLRYTFPVLNNPLTLYTQLAGEDEAGGMPSHFLAQVGAEYKHLSNVGRIVWNFEAADTTAKRMFGLGSGLMGTAYNHGVYKNGLYHDGLPIGHPIGGTGQMYSLGMSIIPDDFRYRSRYRLKVYKANVNEASQPINMAFSNSESWYGGEFLVEWRLSQVELSAGLRLLRFRNAGDTKVSMLFSIGVPFAK